MKKLLLFATSLLVAGALKAQNVSPAKWTYEARKVSEGMYDLIFTAKIQDGWYVYSQYLESDMGPIPSSVTYDENAAVTLEGKNEETGHVHEGYDEMFDMNIRKYSKDAAFTQRVKVKKATALTGRLEYMTCDEEKCLPPVQVEFKFDL